MKKLMMAAMVAMTAVVAWAETVSFSYQGALANADGSAITGDKNKTIQFRLYAGPTDAAALWGRSVSVRLDDNGFFNVELSDGAGSEITGVNGANLDQVLAANAGKLYIGLTVIGSTGEIRPRQKIISVPSAAYAEDVANAKNDFRVAGNAFVVGGLSVDGPMEAKNGLAVNQISVGTNGINVGGPLTVASGQTLTLTKGAKLKVETGATVANADGNDLFAQAVSAAVGQAAPRGVIVMWSGAANAVPAGWALCNGANGTPDLTGRFIVGAGATSVNKNNAGDGGSVYANGAVGGARSVALTKAQMPNHSHLHLNDKTLINDAGTAYNSGVLAYETGKSGYDRGGSSDGRIVRTGTAGGDATDTVVGTDGLAVAHENRPPYYALCFIMKL